MGRIWLTKRERPCCLTGRNGSRALSARYEGADTQLGSLAGWLRLVSRISRAPRQHALKSGLLSGQTAYPIARFPSGPLVKLAHLARVEAQNLHPVCARSLRACVEAVNGPPVAPRKPNGLDRWSGAVFGSRPSWGILGDPRG